MLSVCAYNATRLPLRAGRGTAAIQWRRWMSVRPEVRETTEAARPKVTVADLQKMHKNREPIAMLTAYDYPTAKAASANPNTDIILVGDSLAQVCLGYDSTSQLTLDEMIHHARAVSRGATHPFIVADMPFGSFGVSTEETLRNAVRLTQASKADAIKMEGGAELADAVRRLAHIGIPVMGHIGLMPQRFMLSGFRVQGRTAAGAQRVLRDALALQQAGAFALVLEAIPRNLGAYLTNRLRIPTIGVGAGNQTSGQALVWDDIMGTWSGHKARFARRFADCQSERDAGVQKYTEAVKARSFPSIEESYPDVPEEEWAKFLQVAEAQ
ncbi:ketopantoate hydroxymethyltransferase [Schizophyllum commune H4-8]|uniref:ketopantoate hydroxymethyltransferase n=1 Tax=Schizophyllum commune (strain H4-8 / FGSC 9210) TaxID=578458 RepID=UPI00215F87F1|nr:ketopantoate hydroxymethyltransferase [Schizophyllum commune H4-8]KAI5890081.1 ketopantoate hydroxymethyltransferase [Schizophyllum commune H4-8]